MSEFYDRQGRSMSSEEWTLEGNAVAKTKCGEAEVSTVYLGLDHSDFDGPPLIFETMIFGGPLNEEQWRYTTEAEALGGHRRAVQAVLKAEHSRGVDAGIPRQ